MPEDYTRQELEEAREARENGKPQPPSKEERARYADQVAHGRGRNDADVKLWKHQSHITRAREQDRRLFNERDRERHSEARMGGRVERESDWIAKILGPKRGPMDTTDPQSNKTITGYRREIRASKQREA
jgi:hypothetical protein